MSRTSSIPPTGSSQTEFGEKKPKWLVHFRDKFNWLFPQKNAKTNTELISNNYDWSTDFLLSGIKTDGFVSSTYGSKKVISERDQTVLLLLFP